MADLRLCSNCISYSQASISHCTLKFISIKLELAIAGLRYYFRDYRPSQTNHLKLLLVKTNLV